MFILFIHIIGTLYTEKRFDIFKKGIKILIQIFIGIVRLIFNRLYKFFFNCSSSKVLITKKLPQKYLYNYHLKPTTDLRLQQVENHWKFLLKFSLFLALLYSIITTTWYF